MVEQGLYVYGVLRRDVSVPMCAKPVEPSGGEISMISCDGVSALVSEFRSSSVKPSRANLQAHQAAVEEAASLDTILPMRFGVVVTSEEELMSRFLRPQQEVLQRLLREFAESVEMRVDAQYRDDVALKEAAESEPRIRRFASKVRMRPADATYYDRLALGEYVAQVMQRRTENDARRIGSELAGFAQRARRLPSASENTVFRGGFLIRKSGLERFDRGLAALADREAHRMTYYAVGPLAPWDFTDLELSQPAGSRRPQRTGSMA